MSQFDAHPTAQLVVDQTHAMRNQLATMRGAADLLDDPAARTDAIAAVHVMVRQQERLVVSARIELDDTPDRASHDLAELLDLALRRARREGAPPAEAASASGTTVVGPGVWLERLLVDLLHARRADGVMTFDGATVRVGIDTPADMAMLDWLERIAHATGSTIDVGAGELVVSLPTR